MVGRRAHATRTSEWTSVSETIDRARALKRDFLLMNEHQTSTTNSASDLASMTRGDRWTIVELNRTFDQTRPCVQQVFTRPIAIIVIMRRR